MLIIAIEIAICIMLGIGLIIVLIFYNRLHPERSSKDEKKHIEFLPTSTNEELLVQNVFIAYYEQQRNELIERQKLAVETSKVDITILKNNDSGYVSTLSPTQTPHSLYEYSGFASMDNLEISNPLFTSDVLYDHGHVFVTSSSTKT